MATREQIYKLLKDANPNFGKVDMDTAFKAAAKMNPAWGEAVRMATPSLPTPDTSFTGIKMEGLGAEPIPQQAVEAVKSLATAPGVLPAAGMLAAGAAAAPFTAGLSVPAAIAAGSAAAGVGAMGGEAGRLGLRGEPLAPGKIAKEGVIGALGEGLVRGALAGGSAAVNYVKENPYIRQGMSKLLASFGNQKENWMVIARAIDQNVGKLIPGYEKKVDQIISGTRKAAVTEMPIVERDAIGVLGNLQNQFKNLRTVAGKNVEAANTRLIALAEAKGKTIDRSEIGKALFDFRQDLINSGMKDMTKVKPIIKALDERILDIANKPNISVREAIKQKQVINQLFSNFKSGNMDVSTDPIINEKMQMVAKKLSDKIAKAASDIGDKNFAKAYKNFGEYADHYDMDIQPLFGSETGSPAMLKRFQTIAGGMNTQSLKSTLFEETVKKLPKGVSQNEIANVAKNINKINDQAVLFNLFRDLSGAPSAGVLGTLRVFLGPATKKYVTWAGKTAPVTTSPSIMAPGLLGARGLSKKGEK